MAPMALPELLEELRKECEPVDIFYTPKTQADANGWLATYENQPHVTTAFMVGFNYAMYSVQKMIADNELPQKETK